MEISEIKTKLPLETVLSHYNLHPDRNNRLCCPWHNDKTPSLQVYPKTNTWTCFSSNCNAGSGDQIDFIMKYEKITKYEALIKAKELCGHLRQDFGVQGGEIKESKVLTKTALSSSVDYGEQAILTKYYQGSLHSMQRSKKGKGYTEKRGLDHEKLNIGFCGY